MAVTTRKQAKAKVQTKTKTKTKTKTRTRTRTKSKTKTNSKVKPKVSSAPKKRCGESAQAYSWEAMALKARKALKELDMVLTQIIVAANNMVCSQMSADVH